MRGVVARGFRVTPPRMIRSLSVWGCVIRTLAFFIWRGPANMSAGSSSPVVILHSGRLRDIHWRLSKRWTVRFRPQSCLPKSASHSSDIPVEASSRRSWRRAVWMWMNWSRSLLLWISPPGQTTTGSHLSKTPSIRQRTGPHMGRHMNFISMADGIWWCLPRLLSSIADKRHEQTSIFSLFPSSSINVAGCATGQSSCRWFESARCIRM